MEVKCRPGRWHKKWWKYNLVPHFHAADVSGDDDNIVHRWYEITWGTLIVDVTVPVNREPGDFKLAWSWPKR